MRNRLLPIVLALFWHYLASRTFLFTFYPKKHCQHCIGFSTEFCVKKHHLTLSMSSKAAFCLILVKGAEEAWEIGLMGQLLPSLQVGVRGSSKAYSPINQYLGKIRLGGTIMQKNISIHDRIQQFPVTFCC